MAKVSEEQLEKGKGFRQRQEQITYEMGNLTITELQIKKRKSSLEEEMNSVNSSLQEFMNEISKEFADGAAGSLNLETGEFEVQEAE
jgi:hypothetical protein